VEYDPPSVANICDKCGGDLFQRDDDKPATVRHRLEVYREQTEPLIGFYRGLEKLVVIDAIGAVEDVTERAIGALGSYAD
jgi:adenylate kinase